MSGQWEVVGKNKKTTNKKQSGQVDKNKIMPVIKMEDTFPLQNIYSAITKSNNKEMKNVSNDVNTQTHSKNKKQENVKNKTKKNTQVPKSKPKPKTIESALKLLNIDDFRNCYETNKTNYPNEPLFCLKELAAFLNVNLWPEMHDHVFMHKPDNYPLNIVPSGVREIMTNMVKKCEQPIVQLFFDFCQSAMAHDMNLGHPALGYKIWIQFLINMYPNIALVNLLKHITLRTSYLNRPEICLSLLWIYRQAGLKNYQNGLQILEMYMLPIFEMKNYTRYILAYLNDFVQQAIDNNQLIQSDCKLLLNLTQTKRLPNDVITSLNNLYKKMTNATSESIRNLNFEAVLNSLSSGKSTNLCQSLIQCLVNEQSNFKMWQNIYANYVQQSVTLLEYIDDHWKKVLNLLNKRKFEGLLSGFIITNSELIRNKKMKNTDRLFKSTELCKILLTKMVKTKKTTFPWKSLSFIILFTFISLLLCDVNKSGDWKKSNSVRALKEYGVWTYCEHALLYANEGLNWTKQRIDTYAPGYLDAVGHVLHPYVELASDLGIILYNIGNSIVDRCKQQIPVIIELIEIYVPNLLEHIRYICETFLTISIEFTQKIHHYLVTNVFVGQLSPDNLKKLASQGFNATQFYVHQYSSWIYEKVQSIL